MELIIGSIIITFLIGGTIYLIISRKKEKAAKANIEEGQAKNVSSDCCGAHEVCEFDESMFAEKPIVYFEDEELDRLAGKQVIEFSDGEIDEMREVLYTLQPGEINGWLNSLERRKIAIPGILQQEARQLIADELTRKAS